MINIYQDSGSSLGLTAFIVAGTPIIVVIYQFFNICTLDFVPNKLWPFLIGGAEAPPAP